MKDRTQILSRLEWGYAFAATVFALVLHWRWMQHAGGLWRDEVGTIEFATMSGLKEIWRNLAFDNFPPLVLIPLRLWSALGLSATDMGWRWFGLLMGIALLAAIWVVARMFGPRPPLIALTFAGLSPLAVRTIDSIRPYGLGILLTSLMFGCFWLWTKTPNRKNALLALIAAVLSVQCFYSTAPFVLASVCAAAIVVTRRGNPRAALVPFALGAVTAASLLIHAAHLSAGRKWGMVAQSATPVPFIYLLIVIWHALEEQGLLAALFMVGVIPAFYFWRVIDELIHPNNRSRRLIGAERRRRESQNPEPTTSDAGWFAGTALLIGCASYAGMMQITGLPTQTWYYVILIVFAALALDLAVRVSEPARWFRLGIAVIVGVSAIAPALEGTTLRQTNVDLLAKELETKAVKDDFIVIFPWYNSVSWQHHYHGPTPWLAIPPLSDVRIHRYDLLKEQMMRTNQAAVLEPVIERIRTSLQNGHRVWVVGALPQPTPGRTTPVLAPAPYSEAGWSGEKYELVWGLQLAEFLEANATRLEVPPVPSRDPVNPFENLNLGVWRLEL